MRVQNVLAIFVCLLAANAWGQGGTPSVAGTVTGAPSDRDRTSQPQPPPATAAPGQPAAVAGARGGSDVQGRTEEPLPEFVPGSREAHILERLATNETRLTRYLVHTSPRIEAYLQFQKEQADSQLRLSDDGYFLGRLFPSQGFSSRAIMRDVDVQQRAPNELVRELAQTIVLDPELTPSAYSAVYVGRQRIAGLEAIILDLMPRSRTDQGRFRGRVWVEPQGYNLVRMTGTHVGFNFHFDSWRVNAQPGLWLPAFVYTEAFNGGKAAATMKYKAQIRLWAFSQPWSRTHELFLVSPAADKHGKKRAATIVAMRKHPAWALRLENQAFEYLSQAGLLADRGQVDSVLDTVTNNLLISNNLTLPHPIQCRVLLTTPLEAFTLGDHIILSRGLIDVLPDETSLAMVLAHQLAHVILQHRIQAASLLETHKVLKPRDIQRDSALAHSKEQEDAANQKALALLNNSPYKQQEGRAGLFLSALAMRAPQVPHLTTPLFGDRLVSNQNVMWLPQLIALAPPLQEAKLDQIAAMPLGSRIEINPANDAVFMVATQPTVLIYPRDKMPFEITPLRPYLVRETVASAAPRSGGR